ncbi:unnamed protein product [Amoebophrya sp. A120]|nr:unnamed protein product [Amoebophrya sp. A120]|eukprot:GSA120T00007192001.1
MSAICRAGVVRCKCNRVKDGDAVAGVVPCLSPTCEVDDRTPAGRNAFTQTKKNDFDTIQGGTLPGSKTSSTADTSPPIFDLSDVRKKGDSTGAGGASPGVGELIGDLNLHHPSICSKDKNSIRQQCLSFLQQNSYVLLRVTDPEASAALFTELRNLQGYFEEEVGDSNKDDHVTPRRRLDNDAHGRATAAPPSRASLNDEPSTRTTALTAKPSTSMKKWSNLVKCGYTKRHNADFLDLKNTPLGIRPKLQHALGSFSYNFLRDLATEALDWIFEFCAASTLEQQESCLLQVREITTSKGSCCCAASLSACEKALSESNSSSGKNADHATRRINCFTELLCDEKDEDSFSVSASVLRCSRYEPRVCHAEQVETRNEDEPAPVVESRYDKNVEAQEAAAAPCSKTSALSSGVSFPAHTDATFLTLSLARRGLELLLPAGGEDHERTRSSATTSENEAELGEKSWVKIQDLLVGTDFRGAQGQADSSKSIILTLWIGDYLELFTNKIFTALPHRINFEFDYKDATGCSGSESESYNFQHRHNITFLLRPDEGKSVETLNFFRSNFRTTAEKLQTSDAAKKNSESESRILIRELRQILDQRGKLKQFPP